MKIKIMKKTSTFLLQPHHWSARYWSMSLHKLMLCKQWLKPWLKNHQSITEQAPLPKDHNTVTNDNHQNMTPPPFDKEKLSAMQTQVSQRRMQSSPTYFRNEMAKDRITTGPVKRQVAEAKKNQRKKKKHEALKLTMEKTT
jgi:hypothetical protein